MFQTVAVDDTRSIATKRSGRGEPVVFVHGSGGGLESWDPVVAALPDRFTTTTYARAPYPPSQRGAGPWTFAAEVDDLFAVADATGTRSGHLVGGSYGAIVALHAAVDPRAAWRTVTLFEPPLFALGPSLAPVLTRYRAAVDAGRLAAAARIFAAEVARMPVELLGPDVEDNESPADAAAVDAALAFAADLEAMTRDVTDLRRWGRISAPVLLLHGGATWPPVPRCMLELHAALPPATERVVLAGQSHFATHTAPDRFAAALQEFLDRHPAT